MRIGAAGTTWHRARPQRNGLDRVADHLGRPHAEALGVQRGRAAFCGALSGPDGAADRRRAGAGVARGAPADTHAAPGGRLLPRPRLPHPASAAGTRRATTPVALLRRRTQRPAHPRLRAHRRRAGPGVHRPLELVLGCAARPVDGPVASHHDREGTVNKWIKVGLVLALGVAVSAGVLLAAVWQVLKPAPDEWTERMTWGPWSKEVSMPAVLRLATHPMTLRLLEGHTWRTRFGPVTWRAGEEAGTWNAVCVPCTFRVSPLGRDAVRLSRVEFTVEPDDEMKLHGTLLLGEVNGAIPRLEGRWQSRIERQQVRLSFTLTDQPIARAFGLFSAEVPELRRAQIDGRLNLKAQFVLPARSFTVKPRVDGFRVSGLGTEALLNAQTGCGPSDAAADFGSWLPRAVIAAEDQRFYEHPGFDLGEIMGAWAANPQTSSSGDAALHGGSSLSQQLAKLIYTGDGRDHGRKL